MGPGVNCSFTRDWTKASPSDARSGLSVETRSDGEAASSCFFHMG